MGKSYRSRSGQHRVEDWVDRETDYGTKPWDAKHDRARCSQHKKAAERFQNTIWVALNDIYISDNTVQKLLVRDGAQIEAMRQQFENGEGMVRVVLHDRAGGGYNIEDGRHRVIAAKLAEVGFIEALIISR
jgi:hypothetical protein